MINLLLGISLTLNIVFIVGFLLYFKIKSYGIEKVQKDLADKFFASDEDFNDMLDSL